jgi:hypothetical protein
VGLNEGIFLCADEQREIIVRSFIVARDTGIQGARLALSLANPESGRIWEEMGGIQLRCHIGFESGKGGIE